MGIRSYLLSLAFYPSLPISASVMGDSKCFAMKYDGEEEEEEEEE